MIDLTALMALMPLLNVLIIPALAFVYRIDRRMGQLDVLGDISAKRIDKLERDVQDLGGQLIHALAGRRHI